MKTQYRLRELSQREIYLIEMMLMEEMEMQTWYSISHSVIMDEELFLTLN